MNMLLRYLDSRLTRPSKILDGFAAWEELAGYHPNEVQRSGCLDPL